MTTVDITTIIPSKAKTWVGLVGSLLTFVVPYVLEFADALPAPWPVIAGAVLAVLTALGIYKAPYAPTGTVVAPATPAVIEAASESTPAYHPPSGTYTNPWR
jgi:hypothetical protein